MVKKLSKLTNNNLHRILKETLDTIFEIDNDTNIININSIDISKIDIEILKQSYVDLRFVPTRITYDNPLTIYSNIEESKGDIMSPDNVVTLIKQKYHLNDQLIKKMEASNNIYIYIIYACIGNNDDLIEEEMKKMGYYVGVRSDIQNIQGMLFQILQFEPYSQIQNDETSNIKTQYDYLYHWTPEYYVNDILHNGLIPNHQNNKFNYPNRIYLMKGDTDLYDMLKLGKMLCNINTDSRNNREYVLLKINLKNIDNNIHFYYDPNAEIGVYTEQTISSDNIEIVGSYNF